MTLALGIDVGASKILAAIVDVSTGIVKARSEIKTDLNLTGDVILDQCVELAKNLVAETSITSAGISLCEIVDSNGVIRSNQSIDWRALDIASAFKSFHSVKVESDVRAAALAEATYGAGITSESFLYVNIGSGISSAFVIRGKVWSGENGAAILLGAGPIHAESKGSGLAIARQFGVSNSRVVAKAALEGDVNASNLFISAAKFAGDAIAFAVNLLDPQLVVLGGGLVLNVPIYRQALEDQMRVSIWSEDARNVKLLNTQLSADSAVIGAAIISLDRVKLKAF